MKAVLLSSLLLLIWLPSTMGQTEKGSFLVGGSVSLDNTSVEGEGNFYLGLFPDLGFFVIDDLAIGASVPISTSSSPDYSSSTVGLNPYARYYFYALEQARLFGAAQVGIRSWSATNRGNEQSQTGMLGGLGVGIAYFVRKTVGLEASLNFQRTSWSESPSESEIGLHVGFQIYLDSLGKP